MTTSGSDLAVAAQRYYRDQANLADVAAMFDQAKVAFQRAREPGALVVHTTRFGPWLCVWTSLDRMWTSVGRCHYAITSGADIVATMLPVLPDVTGVIIDADSPHMVPLTRSVLSTVRPSPHPATPGATR